MKLNSRHSVCALLVAAAGFADAGSVMLFGDNGPYMVFSHENELLLFSRELALLESYSSLFRVVKLPVRANRILDTNGVSVQINTRLVQINTKA